MLSTVECFLRKSAWLQFISEFNSMKSVRRLLRIAVNSLPIQLKNVIGRLFSEELSHAQCLISGKSASISSFP